MIYTVTFNPSLDYIVSVEDFTAGFYLAGFFYFQFMHIKQLLYDPVANPSFIKSFFNTRSPPPDLPDKSAE